VSISTLLVVYYFLSWHGFAIDVSYLVFFHLLLLELLISEFLFMGQFLKSFNFLVDEALIGGLVGYLLG